jgi:hypothetical protein
MSTSTSDPKAIHICHGIDIERLRNKKICKGEAICTTL